MASQVLQIFKDGAVTSFTLDPNETLSSVRSKIGVPHATHKFVYLNSVLGIKQLLADQNYESRKRLRDGFIFSPNAVLLANTTASQSDFFGTRVNAFSDRHVSISVLRNKTVSTPGPQDFDPIMLDEVSMANPSSDMAFDRVVVCQEGSLLQFNMSSWGAAGWGYSISSARDVIADSLYAVYTNSAFGTRSTLAQRRYESNNATIRVDALSKSKIPGFRAPEYSKLTFKVWNVHGYSRGATHFQSNATPPPLNQSHFDSEAAGDNLVSGGGAGKTTAGRASSQQFGGGFGNIQEDPHGHVLGAVVFYLVVVKDARQVNEMLKIANARDVLPFPPLNSETMGRLFQQYVRHPAQNAWHTGRIAQDQSNAGSLRWTNNAGVSWTLRPDLANGILYTGPDCPYFNDPRGKFFKIELAPQTGAVQGFRFFNELYATT
jgi:hypothetical protein